MKITQTKLRQIIREVLEAKIGAGKAYLEGPEADFQKTLVSLTKILRDLPVDTLKILRNTDPVYDDHINKALDNTGITDQSRRDLIYKPLKMMMPVDIAGLPRT